MAARPNLSKEDAAAILPVWNEHTDKLREDKSVESAQLFEAMTIGKKLIDFLDESEAPEAAAATEPTPRKKKDKPEPPQS